MDWSSFPYRLKNLAPKAARLRVLGVANLNPANETQKRVDWTLAALALLQKRHPQIRITYQHVGSGARQPELARLADSLGVNAQWLGAMSGAEWAALEADVMLHPTSVETFGMVVYEALHRGIPVIASDLEVFRPWLKPPLGSTCAPGAEAFADSLEAFWMQPFTVPEGALPYENYTPEGVGAQLAEVYSSFN
jgi:glycosyltransferase involved in cell wall biosynthesis